jgi:hypothetical protein
MRMAAAGGRSALVALLGMAACSGEGEGAGKTGGGAPVPLLEGEFRERWKAIEIPDQGEVAVTEEGVLRMGPGKPLTGAVFEGSGTFVFPTRDYTVEFEARRIEGDDFFATLTFPAGSDERCASLVLGGWGGSLVGISSIDHLDASENLTRASIPFEDGRWYRVKMEVTERKIRVWVDGKIAVNAEVGGRVVGMRPGDIEYCKPFGFATYGTSGEVRKLALSKIRGGDAF